MCNSAESKELYGKKEQRINRIPQQLQPEFAEVVKTNK